MSDRIIYFKGKSYNLDNKLNSWIYYHSFISAGIPYVAINKELQQERDFDKNGKVTMFRDIKFLERTGCSWREILDYFDNSIKNRTFIQLTNNELKEINWISKISNE